MKIMLENGNNIQTNNTSLHNYLNRTFGAKFLYAPSLRSGIFWATSPTQHHADLLTEFFGLPDTDNSVDSIADKAKKEGWKAWAGFWNKKTSELAIYNTPEFGETEGDIHRPVPKTIIKGIIDQLESEPQEITIIETKEFEEKLSRILQERKEKK